MPKCSALPQILALLGGVAFAACQWLVFAYAPEEVTLGLAQKIFYIHLPMSWWALVSFLWCLAHLWPTCGGVIPLRTGWLPPPQKWACCWAALRWSRACSGRAAHGACGGRGIRA